MKSMKTGSKKAMTKGALTKAQPRMLTTTEEVQLEANFLNSGDGEVSWYTFALEEPYEVAAGEAVMACFEHLGGDNVQIGTSVPQRDQTVFIYGPFGASSAYDWFFTTNCPMVRLNLDPSAETRFF